MLVDVMDVFSCHPLVYCGFTLIYLEILGCTCVCLWMLVDMLYECRCGMIHMEVSRCHGFIWMFVDVMDEQRCVMMQLDVSRCHGCG